MEGSSTLETLPLFPNLSSKDRFPVDLKQGRDELNFAEWPLSMLGKFPSHGSEKTLVFTDTIFDRSVNKEITRKLTITASDAYGLPQPADEDVLIALVSLSRWQNGFSDQHVKFTRYEMLELLGWDTVSGGNYRRLKQSIERWKGVNLYFEQGWRDRGKQQWMSEAFSVIDNFKIYSSGENLSWIKWNDVVFNSFKAGNHKPLDLEFYFKLEQPTAKRLYRFLDKRFGQDRDRLEFDLDKLAFEKLGLSRNYSSGKIKEKLHPSIEELEEGGYLQPMQKQQRYHKRAPGQWQVNFVKASREIVTVAAQGKEPELSEIVQLLVARGVTAATAAELVSRFAEADIRIKLEVFDWLMEKKDKRVTKNPAGYLVQSIRDDYVAPRGFVSEEERQSRKRQQMLVQQEAERKRQQEQVEVNRQKAEKKHVLDYLNALSEEQRKAFEDEVIANATTQDQTILRQHTPIGRLARTIAVHQEVLKRTPFTVAGHGGMQPLSLPEQQR